MDSTFFQNEIFADNAVKIAILTAISDTDASERSGKLVKIREHPKKGRTAWRLDLPGGKIAYIKLDDLSVKSRWHHRFYFLHPFFREARLLSNLKSAGIVVPSPFMVAFDPKRFFPSRVFLVTSAIDGYEPLGKTLARRSSDDADLQRELKEDWSLTLARLFADLHKTGFYHRDLQKDHLLWRYDGDIKWAMVDLEGAFIKKPLPMWYRIKSLYMVGRHLLRSDPPESVINFIIEYNRLAFPKADPKSLIKTALRYAQFRQEGRELDGKKKKIIIDYIHFACRHWPIPFLRLLLGFK